MFSNMLNSSEWMVVATYTAAAFALIATIIALFRIYQALFKLIVSFNEVELGIRPEGSIEFSLAEIKQATNDFDDSSYIGQDLYGPLYFGLVRNTSMMIKRLTLGLYPRFLAQVTWMAKNRHCNVVNVLGYCCENEHQMIVYEYFSDFTLREFIQNYVHLTFERMVSIALGAAKGLQYLHSLTPPLAHNDFSAATVLLGANFSVKVSDAGLSRLLDIAFDETGDVFSFGLMLLEMLSGEIPIVTELTSKTELFEWLVSRNCSETLFDSRMNVTITTEAVRSFLMVTLDCLWFPAETRPKMVEVVTKLEKILTKITQSTDLFDN